MAEYDPIYRHCNITPSQESILRRRSHFNSNSEEVESPALGEWYSGGGILMVSPPPSPQGAPSDDQGTQRGKDRATDLGCGRSPGRGGSDLGSLSPGPRDVHHTLPEERPSDDRCTWRSKDVISDPGYGRSTERGGSNPPENPSPGPDEVNHTPPMEPPSDDRCTQCSKGGVGAPGRGKSTLRGGGPTLWSPDSGGVQPSRRLPESVTRDWGDGKWQLDGRMKKTTEKKKIPLRDVVEALYKNRVKREEDRRIHSLGYIQIAKHLGLTMEFPEKR